MKFDLLTVSLAAASLSGVDAFGLNADPFLQKTKPYSQDFSDNYNVLKYTSWMGPYSQRRGVGLNRNPPQGCRVDQVISLNRHGERYPDGYTAVAQEAVLAKIFAKKGKLVGSLDFANYWNYYTNDKTDGEISEETTFGPYAGLRKAYERGTDYRIRYNHLYDGTSILPLFSSGYERIADTARWFGQGFLGQNYTDLAALNIIPETAAQGANSLVPVCNTVNMTNCPVTNPADRTAWPDAPAWEYPEFQRAADRLNKENGLNITNAELTDLMGVAAFELNIRGTSPWINVFTSEEWIAWEYYQSAFYYCYAGPGAPSTKPTGYLYLNASRVLLNQGPEESYPLVFSFAHDTDITPVVSLLGFASPEDWTDFDPTSVHFNQLWDVTDLTPQNADFIFERLICEDESQVSEAGLDENILNHEFPAAFNLTNGTTVSATYASNYTYEFGSEPIINGTRRNGDTIDEHNGQLTSEVTSTPSHPTGKENIYVRIVLNDAVVPLPACHDGPGQSCLLSSFNQFVDKSIGNASYAAECNNTGTPETLTFYWDWNVTNYEDAVPNPIPFQAGLLYANGSAIPKSSS